MKVIDLEQLKNNLRQQYDIDCWVFLEDLEHSSSSTFYRELSPFQQTSYKNNYRFILCNTKPLQVTTLDHVINIINYLDISPYFVEVYTNQNATAEYFESRPESFKVTLTDIQRIEPTLNNIPVFNANKKLCVHPWAGFHIWTDGTVGPCCEYDGLITDDNNVPYNINLHSAEQILSSKYMDNLRGQMREGQDPAGCKKCVTVECTGGKSRRNMAPYRLENIWGLINWESDGADNLSYLSGHLGNLCNLKCRICNPTFSSSIATEELAQVSNDMIKSHPVYTISKNTNWARKKTNLWDSLKDRPQIKNFEFLGGEPFLLKQNLDFMQYLLDNDLSQDSIFDFTSNGTVYPEIFDRADQFKRLVVTLSIDNIGSRFEYERSGSDWNILEANVKKFMQVKASNNKFKIGVAIAVNIQNVFYLPELISWIQQHHFDHYYYNIVTEPKYLSVTQLTNSAQQLVLNKLTNCELNAEDKHNLQYVIQTIKQSTVSDGKEFVKYMRAKDCIRNENFAVTHEEISSAMGYQKTV
jgi:MoaA/NifB/PqqE/SkfB family radical SAM enzyme